jgi:hypothetical protein
VLQIEMKLMMETDPAEIINEIIYATRKGGCIGIGASFIPGYEGSPNRTSVLQSLPSVKLSDLL